jgi:AraC-like DNA-binding protein
MLGIANPTNNEITSRTLLSSGSLRIDLIEGSKRRPSLTELTVRAGQSALEVNLSGTQLMRESDKEPWRVLPPKSIALVRGPTSLTVHLGRGEHRSLYVTWSDNELPGLARWMERTANERKISRRFSIVAFNPINSVDGDVAEKMTRACFEPSIASEPIVLASIHEVACHALTSDNEFCLATLPISLPEPMYPLIEQVKADPAASWSLKEAATIAGYSPFHLSRTFKALVGFGFPEFVDRCRTEIAVVQLCNSDKGIEEIANNCGFGSPQALRESVKEYLGMLPSELRLHATGHFGD